MAGARNVGFIGLGAMGSGMAKVLVTSGFAVKGYDVWKPSLDSFVKAGGAAAEDPKGAAQGADALVLMVVNAAQAEEVLFDHGAAGVLRQPSVVILCSTIPPSGATVISDRLKRLGRDIEFVDAPVSGGVARAAAGSLAIMGSGSDTAWARAGPLLESMTAVKPGTLFRINGGVGAGSSVKMVNQLLAGVHIAAAAEAMALGASLGLDTRQLFDVISAAAGSSWMFCNRVPQMLNDDPTPHSALNIFVKDLGIVLSEGTRTHFPLPLSAAAHQQFLMGSAMGLGRQADAMVVKVFPGVNVAAVKPTAGAEKVELSSALSRLPSEWSSTPVASTIRSAISNKEVPPIVVLDDDPTGTQTVHGVNVLMEWSVESLQAELKTCTAGFFVLTNTRAMSPEAATATIRDICTNMKQAASGSPFTVVLRSDSTLRGHFPTEGDAVCEILGRFDLTILCPFFFAGGRYTIDDVHYVKEGDDLVPAADTEFAQDKAFGYTKSNLKEYVQEKTKGLVQAKDVASVSIEVIRTGGPEGVCKKLLGFPKNSIVVVNAASNSDLDVFAAGMLKAEHAGLRVLCRTAASFVSARMGIPQIDPLTREDLGLSSGRGGPGGLIVVGSYVPKTTAQVAALVRNWSHRMECIYVSAEALCSDDLHLAAGEVARAAGCAEHALREGREALVCTTRELLSGSDAKSSLDIGNRISRNLVAIVRAIRTRPRFLLAKGGITSSDLATAAMEAKSAHIVGQAAPGVPLWQLGKGSRHEGMPYIVFPGNVGTESTVAEVVERLAMPPRPGTADLMRSAAAGSYAVGAFNVYDVVGASAVVRAAESTNSPAMLQIHPASLRAVGGGDALVAACLMLAKQASVPITVHLDHAGEGDWEEALRLGMDSVLVDGSGLPYEENKRLTRMAVQVCHARGMAVEAEIGRLSGTEDGLTVEEYEAKLTDPAQAAEFVRETGVDMLAVCVGNVHGRYPPGSPKIDVQRIKDIRAAVPREVGLVLHGASGIPRKLLEQCTAAGVAKYNVNTEVRAAYVEALQTRVDDTPPDLTHLHAAGHMAMIAVIKEKLELFGSVGKV